MTENDRGRHCDVCAKTVVDFTKSSSQEILFHMRQSTGNVCGRFLPEQLEEPIPTPEDFIKQLHYFRIPFLRKIAAIFLFSFSAFMMSCKDGAPAGKIAIAKVDSPPPVYQLLGDTTVIESFMPLIKPERVKLVCKPAIMGKMIAQPAPLQGDIVYIDTTIIPVPNVIVGKPAVYDTTRKKK